MRPDHARFVFTDARIEGAEVLLSYRLAEGTGPDVDFTERLTLPILPEDPSHPAIKRALRDLHLITGISYFKATCAAEIEVATGALSEEEAAFWSEVYTFGLGEFFFRNDIESPSVTFPAGGPPRPEVAPLPFEPDRVLLLVGGGKDSVVAREVLRHVGVDVTVVSLSTAPWIRRSAEAMGDAHLTIGRKLDRKLFELNDAGALNGHIPISAIIAAATRLVASIGGFGAVISANEHSASEGNLQWRGMEVNHQWSKGIRFERLWQQHSGPGPTYFSLLRPLSELAIGACLARHDRYFDHITSCNANFRIRPGEPPARWCGHCPKCVFVYTILAPHLDDARLDRLFGKRILEDAGNLPMVRRLLGVTSFKPLECVGTSEEVSAAMWRLHADERAIAGAAGVVFAEEVLPGIPDPESLWRQELTPASDDAMPPRWRARLDAYLSAR
ncbi:MAG: hypothetical protein ACI8RZ_005213 [Myxococcota bacterium]|jgi:hypothetical protein